MSHSRKVERALRPIRKFGRTTRWLKRKLGDRDLEHSSYWSLVAHIERHKMREWILEGARREKAVTVAFAVARLSDEEFVKRFARALARR